MKYFILSSSIFISLSFLSQNNCVGKNGVYQAMVFTDNKFDTDNGSYILKFEDDFNGNTLDLTKWREDIAEGSLNGYEVGCYNQLKNVEVSGGTCKLISKQETVTERQTWWEFDNTIMSDGLPNLRTYDVTTGQIISKNEFFYGKYEIRCKLPKGLGYWPAFWMFGGPIWNEIDVFEIINQKFTCNVHEDFNQNGNTEGENCMLKVDLPIDYSDWHTYTCLFEPDKITWLIDGVVIRSFPQFLDLYYFPINPNYIKNGGLYNRAKNYPIDKMAIRANLAVFKGASKPSFSDFPGVFEIDYIKFYQKINCLGDLILITETNQLPNKINNIISGNKVILANDLRIENRKDLEIYAGNIILIEPGFVAKSGCNFTAKIEQTTCNSSGMIISNENNIVKSIDEIKSLDKNNYDKTSLIDNQYESGSILINPNPSKGKFNLDLNEVIAEKVTVYNMLGKVVFDTDVSEETRSIDIDLTELPASIYMVHVHAQGEVIMKKVVKE